MNLPEDLHARPLTPEDLDATVAMVNACELHDTGEVMLERADLLADSRSQGFDLARDWIGVFRGREIVARAIVETQHSASVDVHPDVRGRGIGTWLRRWTEDRARAVGFQMIRQTLDDRRSDVIAMLAAGGYTPQGTSWILRMDHPVRPHLPVPPDGVELRPYRTGDEEEVLAMLETAFSEWEGRQPTAATTWRAMVTRREGFEPEDLVVAVADNRIVGGAFLIDADGIWVDKLAVAREFRHRGIARALLETGFARSFDRGYTWTSLTTDSRTGALSLYEGSG